MKRVIREIAHNKDALTNVVARSYMPEEMKAGAIQTVEDRSRLLVIGVDM